VLLQVSRIFIKEKKIKYSTQCMVYFVLLTELVWQGTLLTFINTNL
jgi:hypothetical protein